MDYIEDRVNEIASAIVAQVIEDAITNSTTSKAPTSNAVYDALASKLDNTVLTVQEQASPSNPASGYYKLFVKSDGKLYIRNSAGTEAVVGTQS
jgi:hypothetical protein